jgi:glycosyltransferase involved in cell wall biosynthesis
MNILHIITGLGMGGAERVVLDLAAEAQKRNHVVRVIYLSKLTDLLPKFGFLGIQVTLFDFSNPGLYLCNIINILSFIKRSQIQIVHLHLAHPVLISPFIFLFTNAKIVFTSHSFNIGGIIREFYVWLLRPFRHHDILFSKNQYKYFYKNKFSIIENGIDIERYHITVPKSDVFTFISVGRLMKVKNQIYLIEMMDKMIHAHQLNCRLLIVGDGDLRDEINKKIALLNLQDYIVLLGNRDDINVLMAKSHCFLLPSLWEGMPIVLLESGASKLPIISTNVGSITTLLNEENSYISNLEDFEKNMLYVIDNYEEASYKANILYQMIRDNYSIENIANKHIELYSSLLKLF